MRDAQALPEGGALGPGDMNLSTSCAGAGTGGSAGGETRDGSLTWSRPWFVSKGRHRSDLAKTMKAPERPRTDDH